MNFDEIRLLFFRNFAEILGRRRHFSAEILSEPMKFLSEPHKNSNAGRKFADLTTKFRLEFVHCTYMY